MSQPIIRLLEPTDRAQWETLYHSYAEFYRAPMDQSILNTVWDWIFTQDEAFFCLVAERDEELIGFMHFREMASPLRGKKVGFLDDLFIAPPHRSQGVVETLYTALHAAAKKHQWPLVRWITAEDNYRGRSVYDKLAKLTHWKTYQLDID